MSKEKQPLENLKWVDPTTLTANDYNPNHVAPPEMELLKISILENGWTQPIVISPDGTIVDGFHRWTLGLKDKEVQKLTDGLVPVVTLTNLDQALSRLATIRHNRARGNHYVVKMADIIHELKALNLSDEEISQRLGMELEEVERLFDRGRSTKRNALKEFNKGWVPG
jgi:ParB-like chromosome segregation protein Spo0J